MVTLGAHQDAPRFQSDVPGQPPPMGPKQPTGQSYRTQGAFRIDFSAGKIRSIPSYWDTAAMAKQLGIVG